MWYRTLTMSMFGLVAACAWAQPAPGQVGRLLALPSGELLSLTNTGNTVQLAQWSAAGEPLAVHAYAQRAGMGAERLASGMVLVPADNATRVFNGAGELEDTLSAGGGYITELGEDSLLFCWGDRVKLQRADGTVLWERDLEIPSIPEGIYNSRAAALADGFVVYTGYTDIYTTAGLMLGIYNAAGEPVNTFTLHADGGSLARVHAMLPMQNGDVLGVATMGNGAVWLVRVGPAGDTLWVRHFGYETLAEGYPEIFQAERAVELVDGRIVLAGIGGQIGPSKALSLLVLDAAGHPLCLEPVVNVPWEPPTYDLAVDAAGDPRLLYAFDGEVPVLTHHPQSLLCSTINVPDVEADACWQVRHNDLHWLVDRNGCTGAASYTLYDLAGRVLHEGELSALTTLPTASGMRFLRVVQRNSAVVHTVKLPALD